MRLILSAIPPDAERILDIGCVHHTAARSQRDNDWLHQHLCETAPEVIGIDLLETEIKKLREHGYDVYTANAESYDLDGTFDCVVAGEMLQMVSNPGRMLDNTHAHQRAGDSIVISVPHPFCFAWIKNHLKKSGSHWNPNCVAMYSESTLSSLLDRHGYELEGVWYGRAEETGLTSLLHRIGFKRLGATRIVVHANRR